VKRAASSFQLNTSDFGTTTRDGPTGFAGGAQLAAGFEQRQYLRGLAHTHVVC